MLPMIDLHPNDIITRHDDVVGIVESEPFLSHCLLSFWQVVVIYDEDGDGAYPMPTDVAAIVEVERGGVVIWSHGVAAQMSLWEAMEGET